MLERPKIKLTRGEVRKATCPPGKSQNFYRDTEQAGLCLRVTASGAKSFVFESKLGRQTVRMTIGPATMPIRTAKDARGRPVTAGADAEAARLAELVRKGIDPRADKAATIARHAAERQAAKAERAKLEIGGLDAWGAYIEERRRHWGKRNYADHLSMSAAGGMKRRRGDALTKPGALYALLNRPLADIGAEAVEAWVARESKARPVRAALGFRQLRAFINWCAEHRDYRTIVQPDACSGRRVREKLGKPTAKADALQREQLPLWFAEVRKLSPVSGAYLQALLLTGARREELLSLRWADVGFRWRSLTIRDKVEGERTIPLTPYVASLMRDLKARNEKRPEPPRRIRAKPELAERWRDSWRPSPWVFSSPHGAEGRLQDPRIAHNRALAAAGLPHVTLHGLRRSFGTLSEWVECPVGIVAQIQGHKPSAIAEKHYRVRPLDLLRLWHDRIEAWILTEAGIEQPKAEAFDAPALRVVGGKG